MLRTELNTIENCPMKGRDVFLTGDLPSFAYRADSVPANHHNRTECKSSNDWTGRQSYEDAIKFTRSGDLKRVAPSDAWLTKFEDLAPMRGAFESVRDVIGGSTNVPAFLSGHPLNMRRRTRVVTESAPLAVCVDLVSSAGIKSATLEKRGALILALVRALSAVRPVTLWVGGSSYPYDQQAGRNDTYHVWMTLDTAPLDLARAAHALCSPAFSRGLIYATIAHENNPSKPDSWGLSWPYRDHMWSRANMRPVLSRVIGSDDMLCIAAPHVEDRLVNEPEAWFADMLKTYGGVDHEA